MERYREYKESGVKWLGEIPSHWEVKRLGSFFSERKEKVSDQDYAPLSVTKQGIFPQLENVAKTNDGDNRKLVKEGDFVINSRSDRKGSSGVSELDGSVSLINLVLQPRKTIFGPFCNYLLKSYGFIEENYRNGRGIVADLWTTRYNEMKMIKVAMPSLEEQKTISSYLDSATSEIDKAIAMQQKMIDLLNERKQIIIQNAVTKGLDENVEMKESGVEWIGRIPKHWEVVRLSHLTSKIGSGSTPKAGYVESGIIFLRSQNVYCEGLKLNDVVHISANVHRNMSGTKVLPNDVLMNITGGSIGRCFYVDETLGEANVNQHVSIIRPTSIDTHYLKYYLQSYCGQIQVSLEQTGGNREGLTAKALAKFLITYPSQSEQKEIAAYLDGEMEKFDSAITNCQRQITLLQERKQIIINEVVTGKVRVI